MSLFGRFLELSLPASNVAESLDWYLQLGFTECQTGDIYDHHYAVVTDGRLCIGLHSAGPEAPALTFVRPDLSAHLSAIEQLGAEVAETYQGDERFHQLTFPAPGGIDIRLIEARTFSPPHEAEAPEVGQVRHLTISTPYPDDAKPFWTAGGLSCHDTEDDGLELLTPGLSVAVTTGRVSPVLTLHHADIEHLTALLARKNLRFSEKPAGIQLVSPEGLKLIVAG